jgi:hypothetical protein
MRLSWPGMPDLRQPIEHDVNRAISQPLCIHFFHDRVRLDM